MTSDELEEKVAFAFREQFCSTKQSAKIIVTVSPEAAAAEAVRVMLETPGSIALAMEAQGWSKDKIGSAMDAAAVAS